MQSELVSVVVPVYNVEKYLNRCLDSIVSQTYKNIEIILVDDGSTDMSSSMCDEWRRRDNRIKVVHKKNAGLGEARNSGIENATGKYICFVDSDDYIELRTISTCVALAEEKELDLVSYGFNKVNASGEIKSLIPRVKESVYVNNQVVDSFLPQLMVSGLDGKNNNLQMSLCASFIKMYVIRNNNWRCASERQLISEDVYSLLELYKYIKSVGVIEESYYYYCENPSSLSHSYRSDRFEKNKSWYYECRELCDRLGYPSDIKKYVTDQFFSNVLALMKIIVNGNDKRSVKRKNIKIIIRDKTMREILKIRRGYSDTKKRCIICYLMHVRAYYLCYLVVSLQLKKS